MLAPPANGLSAGGGGACCPHHSEQEHLEDDRKHCRCAQHEQHDKPRIRALAPIIAVRKSGDAGADRKASRTDTAEARADARGDARLAQIQAGAAPQVYPSLEAETHGRYGKGLPVVAVLISGLWIDVIPTPMRVTVPMPNFSTGYLSPFSD